MKRALHFTILTVFLTTSFFSNAQGEEKNIVSRRHYESIEKKYTAWYNNVSAITLFGIENTSAFDTTTLVIYSLSYERLKRMDLLYYGPGIVASMIGEKTAFDAAELLEQLKQSPELLAAIASLINSQNLQKGQ